MHLIACGHALKRKGFGKILLVMKLTAILLFSACLTASANGFAQNVSLSETNASLQTIFKKIKKQTGYTFAYTKAHLLKARPVTISISNASIEEVLDLCFQSGPLDYTIINKTIVIIDKKDEPGKEQPSVPPPPIQIQGKITNDKGETLAGASVVVKRTGTGVSANDKGEFRLNDLIETDVLIISFTGYQTQEIAVKGKTFLNIQLKPTESKLDDLVVIGYGQASKRDLTGSIVKISGKEVADKPNTNPISSLQSKVSGLYVVNNGTPGSYPDIRIRGTLSIGQVGPLYVVDGIVTGDINYLNPNDIESIEVLKDPSSLAIFGVKGATGVIAITTKKAKAGQTIINFSSNYGSKQLVDKLKLADSSQFNTLFAEENANNGTTTPDYSVLNSNTDWIDAVTRTGIFSNTNLSVTGSTEKNRFYLGLGYTIDEGIIKHQRLEKMQLSLSDEFRFNKNIKVGFVLNSLRTSNPSNVGYALDAARKVMPQVSADPKTFEVSDPYTNLPVSKSIYSTLFDAIQNSGVYNPLIPMESEWNKLRSIEYRNVGSVYAEINFLKYFNIRTAYYADVSNVNSRSYKPLYYAYNPVSNLPFLYSNSTQVNETSADYKKFQQDYILTFKKAFGDHSVTTTTAFTTNYFGNFNRYGQSVQGTSPSDPPIPDNEDLWYINNGFGIAQPSASYQSENTTLSYLARLLYNYKSKYFLTASWRNDASSRIPPKNRYQQFWALGGAWEMSRESYMKNVRVIDYLKLKGSIGVLGNQSSYGPVGDYPFYPAINQNSAPVSFGNNIVRAAQLSYQINPDLKWETIDASEAGIELTAFNNRLHFEANYFNKVTKGMMTYLSLGILGRQDQIVNGGKIKNWGEEFSATWNQKVAKDLEINLGGNITFMNNKVVEVATGLPGGQILEYRSGNGRAQARTSAGNPIGSFYGYVVEGIYQSQLDILKSPSAASIAGGAPISPGDLKFKDLNGDGLITEGDRTVIGNPSPDFIYGATVSATYKRFNVSVDLGGVYGNEIYRTWGTMESQFQFVNYPASRINRWHGAGTSNWEPILSSKHQINSIGSTYNIEDGSYFRLRNLQIGYDFDPRILSKIHVNSLRVYANAQNLKTWKRNEGYTPEFGGSATAFGFDDASGAIPRVFTFGLNVTF
ncbi:SusC/RagA family TonB-linked outer membrane protein [Terrimonas pollutisoli]|uniref:SusC/RagA family TonB-linked outer membrane protein n=1 Tax=Terrimonas pollutisoli TaxID=3034147 RepID=UPI0023EB2A4E|nr:SusC/RagA family TonB-linked outer membrane protein [Terrimonas sp. H1YJ31]